MSSNSTSPFPTLAGGIPDNTDKVLSVIYIIAFAVAGLFLQLKTRRLYGNKFIWSRIGVSFSVARIIALVFRILVADNPSDKSDNITEQILISSGVTILYILNAQMSRRFLGQLHPQSGKIVRNMVFGILLLIIPVIAIVIASVVQSLNTTDSHTLSVDHTLRKFGSACMIIFAILPIPIITLGFILHKAAPNTRVPQAYALSSENPSVSTVPFAYDPYNRQGETGYKPGHSPNPSYASYTPAYNPGLEAGPAPQMTMNMLKSEYNDPPRVPGEPTTGFGPTPTTFNGIMTNAAFILIPTLLLTIQSFVKFAQSCYSPAVGEDSPWYMSKAALWIFGFTFELIAIFTLGLAILPKRFSYLKPI